jgi:hypothetical protein
MPLVMFIDTREPFDEQSEPARDPWIVSLLEWVLPWPALIVWLCVASRLIDGWIGVFCVFAAIWLSAWRGLRALPTDGLNQMRQ